MFGYVVADPTTLDEAQLQRYRGCYCGLCRSIGSNYGFLQRLALNYDMTFLVLLLSSLYEPEETEGCGRCVVHPIRPGSYRRSTVTDYAAAMNMALAYHNCIDDWHDDRSILSLAEAKVFRKSAEQAAAQYPRQWQAILRCMQQLSQLEQDNVQSPDEGANAFGDLMGELFVLTEDRWAPLLRQLGQSLGRFIYLMDAVLDLPADRKHNNYNPLQQLAEGKQKEDFRQILALHLGECTEAFERLPLVQDTALLRNILYSGVWTKYDRKDRVSGRRQNHV